MKERKTWTKEEDQILRLLKEVRGQKKWSAIAKKMEEQFSISGRSGKQCRQRYHNHLDSTIKLTEWTPDEQRVLFQMHDEVGNRWSVIAHHLSGRTDNGVKNHFYSKLRKAIRRINKVISQNYKKQYKQIKTSLLYKIIETSESKFKVSSMVDEQVADFCTDIKNKLYYFQQNFVQTEAQHMTALKVLIEDILNFGKNEKRFKVKNRKSSGTGKDLLHPDMYLIKVRSNSQYSSSEFSSKGIDSSSYCQESDEDQEISISHKSVNTISKKQTNPTKSCHSTANLRLTRSRSKDETFSSVKSPECFSDDQNLITRNQLQISTGENFLSMKMRNRNPSFSHERSQWSNQAVEQILMAQNVIEQKSSGSNRMSRNSRSNSINRSHVNLFFQDSHFQMRILSPKNFPNQEKMSQQQQLFREYPMEIQFENDRYSVNSDKTFNIGKEIHRLNSQNKDLIIQEKQESLKQKVVDFKCFENEEYQKNETFKGPFFEKNEEC